MSKSIYRVAAMLAMAVLLVGSTVAFAMDEGQADQSLTGQLIVNDQGTYYLVEEDSGEQVRLVGSGTLADHIEQNITVTGKWGSDDAGEYFEVRSIEPAS